jgi:hypothetical protein
MGGGLKVSPPPYEVLVIGYPPAPPPHFWKKWYFRENFDFIGQKNDIFQKIFDTSRDFHISAVNFQKLVTP